MDETRELAARVLCPRYPLGLEGLDFGDGGRRPLPGGFCVFAADLPDSLHALADARARRGPAPAPFICADLERGAGHQVPGLTRLPPGLALGATGSTALARAAGALTAREALRAGIGVILAPVLDVADEPRNPIVASRSFSADPHQVATIGAAWIAGCIAAGARPTAKHFPGHGATLVDSHVALPQLLRSAAELAAVEEVPFRAAIAAGVPATMVGHLCARGLGDPADLPATFSESIVNGSLRLRLGFAGAVLTDALDMGAVLPDGRREDLAPEQEPAVRALRAGCDVLLLPDDPHRAARNVVAAVERGLITREALRLAARRVGALVAGLAPPAHPDLTPDAEGGGLALDIARRAVVREGAPGGAEPPPLAGREVELVVCDDDPGAFAAARLLERLAAAGIRSRVVPPATPAGDLPRLVAVIGAVRGGKGRIALEAALAGAARQALLASNRSQLLSIGPPQTVAALEGLRAACYVFDSDAASLTAAAEVLAGSRPAAGRRVWARLADAPGPASSPGGEAET